MPSFIGEFKSQMMEMTLGDKNLLKILKYQKRIKNSISPTL